MSITPLPTPPSRQQSASVFSANADALFGAFPAFVAEANALLSDVEDIKTQTQEIKTQTQGIRDDAVADVTAIKAATESVRDTASVYASIAESSAILAAARAAEAAASANFIGSWSSLSGSLSIPASVSHAGNVWVLVESVADVTAHEPGVSGSWLRITGASIYTYDNRDDLRTATETPGATAIVDGLGLFVWHDGSDEPDDDESCFATANGRWLIEAAHWDLVAAWQAPDWDADATADEDLLGRFLTATFTQSITSVSTNTTTSVTVSVNGAEIGDDVIVTRSGSSATNPQGGVFGVVTADNTVAVYLCADNVTSNFHAGTWRVTVIKPE